MPFFDPEEPDKISELTPEEIAGRRIGEALASTAPSINLRDLKLRRVPDSIVRVRNLQSLDISGNQLTELPEFSAHSSTLRSLYLSGNHLSRLPESIGQLKNLESFDVSGNQLGTLPQSTARLTKLRSLYLSGNHFKSVPEPVSQLVGLRSLDISGNELTELPHFIGELTSLQYLYLSKNRLSALPESIGRLTKLQNLYLSRNQLTQLPESIGQLISLRYLYLSNNKIKILPESVGQLLKLQYLDLLSNELTSLPAGLRQLKALERLLLHRNDGLSIPAEILGVDSEADAAPAGKPADPASILDYYFRTRGGAKPLNEAKLIVVGRGEVGKTSLVKQLVFGKFDPFEKKTEGIGITPWQITPKPDCADVRVNIWDFGGQEIMHATHQFFLTERSLYLLVLNGREGGEDYDAEYWLKLISSFGGESPVILVLNKIKQHPFDLNYRALLGKYPQIRGFFKTDCEPKTGIAEVAEAICNEIGQLKDVHAKFPASWFAIKDALAGMKENFMSLDRYRELCRQHNEMDVKAQDDLAGYLHCLGIALNYKDDPRLRDTSILNPHWVTAGIYKLLNAEKLAKDKGVLSLRELSALLPPQDYPEEKHEYLLELMRKFKLCFAFPNDETEHRYLVPELLDKQEPGLREEFDPAHCLNFEYHYTILPEGLMPSFIVRTHALSEGQPRWRTGVVLRWEQSRALVKADAAEKKIVIRVTGLNADGRRKLLAVIRSDFERIHSEMPKLEVIAKVPLPGAPNVLRDYEELVVFEKDGTEEMPANVGGKTVKVKVRDVLKGVDLEETTRQRTERETDRRTGKSLFYSYSHKDEGLRDELDTHLKLLQRQGVISIWHDRKILAGEEWKDSINSNLDNADIILLLISADFVASDYCYEKEMKRAMERQESEQARVIPVILRACDWNSAPFGKLQALPKDAKPVTRWPDRDEAWNDVALGIRRMATT
jgi:internalin A